MTTPHRTIFGTSRFGIGSFMSRGAPVISTKVPEQVVTAMIDAPLQPEISTVLAEALSVGEDMAQETHEEASSDEAATLSRYALTDPVYADNVRLADFNTKANGMTAIFHLIDADPSRPNPFKGLKVGNPSGHRLHVVVSRPTSNQEPHCYYSGEGILNRWAETPESGMSATIRFDGGPDGVAIHPLSEVHPGSKDGETLYLACWAVSDDEALMVPANARKTSPRPFNTVGVVQQAAIKCKKDTAFQDFCYADGRLALDPGDADGLPIFEDNQAAFASCVVRLFCRVTSRAELGHDTPEGYEARNRWTRLMRDFDDWQRGWKRVAPTPGQDYR